MIMQWNYPEAALDTDMYAKNTTFYASQKWIVSPLVGDMLESQLPGNMVVEDYYSTVYVEANDRLKHFIYSLK